MKEAQDMVLEFHRAMDQTIGRSPALRDSHLRADLIAEETHETIDAIFAADLPKAVDGLCDLIYVCLGAAVAWGVDLAPIFAEVQRANMAKVGGPVRADGKKLKPPGWTPPDIEGRLREQGWKPVV